MGTKHYDKAFKQNVSTSPKYGQRIIRHKTLILRNEKIRHTESQMVKAIHQLEQGITSEVVCREYGVSRGTLYNWRCKYGGMDISQIKKF